MRHVCVRGKQAESRDYLGLLALGQRWRGEEGQNGDERETECIHSFASAIQGIAVERRPLNHGRVSAMHDKAAVDAEGLTCHVIRARRYEKPDHVGDVLRPLHAPQGDSPRLPSGELLG